MSPTVALGPEAAATEGHMHQDDPTDGSPSPATPISDGPELVAYTLHDDPDVPLLPGPVARAWMEETAERYANRCLPLLIANQSGWLLLNPSTVFLTWDGSPGLAGVTIEYDGPEPADPGDQPLRPRHRHLQPALPVPDQPRLEPVGQRPLELPDRRALRVGGRGGDRLGDRDLHHELAADDQACGQCCQPASRWPWSCHNAAASWRASGPACGRWRPTHRWRRPSGRGSRVAPSSCATCRLRGRSAARRKWEKDYFRGRGVDGENAGRHQTRLRVAEFGPATPDVP